MVDKHPRFTYIKRQTYYFSRSVPVNLRDHYGRSRIVQSLGTNSRSEAKILANALASRLDEHWLGLRLKLLPVPASDLFTQSQQAPFELPSIEDCLDKYLSARGREKTQRFHITARRNIAYLTKHLGNKPLDCYKSTDAVSLRDRLLDDGLSGGSILRIFGGIKAVINFVSSEYGYDYRNPFSGVYLPSASPKKRLSISIGDIIKLQTCCKEIDDDIRWLVALISDTGMRLSEATGLLSDDLCLKDDIPHVIVQPHPHRRLKTNASNRVIPLIGCSFWAALRIKQQATEHCFPRYSSQTQCKSNSASASLNKWMKSITNTEAVIHGLRHSFRDRLRAIEAPTDMIDQIGGWSTNSIGQSYGDGYSLKVTRNWLSDISLKGENT